MRELSVFVDESGNLGDDAKYYLLALVLHDQSKDVVEHIGRYESTLAQRGLRDIPLHRPWHQALSLDGASIPQTPGNS